MVAVRDSQKITTYDLILSKGLRDRAGEDTVASLLLIQALARAAGIQESINLNLADGEGIDSLENPCSSALTRLIEGEIKVVLVQPDGRWLTTCPKVEALLPGAFNPWHEGHLGLAHAADEILHGNVLFELSIINIDKPPLREPEIRRRLEQFAWRENIILTWAPTFRDKAELFPGCTFVVALTPPSGSFLNGITRTAKPCGRLSQRFATWVAASWWPQDSTGAASGLLKASTCPLNSGLCLPRFPNRFSARTSLPACCEISKETHRLESFLKPD